MEKRRHSSWEAVYGEFTAAGEGFIDRYGRLSAGLFASRIWPGRPYTPAKILRINLHHYGKSHLPEITTTLAALEARHPA